MHKQFSFKHKQGSEIMASNLQEIFKLAAKHFYKKYKKKGGSQAEIAEKLDITQSYISAVMSGSRTASLELMEQIAGILYGPFEEFLVVGRRIQNGLEPEIKEKPEPKQDIEKLIAQFTHYVVDYQRIAKELAATKDFYKDIVQNLQSGVIVTDCDDTVFFANRMMFDITNIPQERLLGINIFSAEDKFPGFESAEFSTKYQEAKKSLHPLFYENITVVTPGGLKTYLSGWMIPKVLEGEFDGMTCTIRDNKGSQELSMLLRITLDNNPDAIGITKMQQNPWSYGTTYFTNKKMRKLFGLQETDYKNISINESLDRCEKFIRNKKRWRKFLEKHAAERLKGSFVIRHTNGKDYRWTSQNLLDNEGKPWGRMAIVKEIGKGRRKQDK
jgi:transcriptional regulator with XRE-family HTH domain